MKDSSSGSNWRRKKLLDGYRFTALYVVNVLVGLALLNVILSVVFRAKDYLSRNPVATKYGASILSSLYQDLSEREIDDLLKETWSRPYVYDPFTQFKERPYRGVYVNVDPNGFRITKKQGPWPPQSNSLNIFLFGGSTTFGYGVRDDQTIASYLQENVATKLKRNIHVYNFGCGFYYSTQERIFYERLLTSGFVPDFAIFVDGLNDFFQIDNEPVFTNRFRALIDAGQMPMVADNLERFITSEPVTIERSFIAETSLGRAAIGVQSRFFTLLREREHNKRLNGKSEKNSKKYSDPIISDRVIKTYLANKKSIEALSKAFGLKPIFIWQPVPMYNYDQRYHVAFTEPGYEQYTYVKYGYEHMAKLIREKPFGGNFLWSADIQKDAKEPLYIDKVHYSPRFSKIFATVIADFLF